MKSCKIICYLIIFSISGFLHAQTVTISIIQNERAPAIAINMTRTIENQILDSFFDFGFIVSNADIIFNEKEFSKPNFGIKEASFGMSDYLFVFKLNYASAEKTNLENKKTYAQLESIVWRVVNVKNSYIISEKEFDISSVPIRDFDPYQHSRALAKLIAADANAVLRNEIKKEKK